MNVLVEHERNKSSKRKSKSTSLHTNPVRIKKYRKIVPYIDLESDTQTSVHQVTGGVVYSSQQNAVMKTNTANHQRTQPLEVLAEVTQPSQLSVSEKESDISVHMLRKKLDMQYLSSFWILLLAQPLEIQDNVSIKARLYPKWHAP